MRSPASLRSYPAILSPIKRLLTVNSELLLSSFGSLLKFFAVYNRSGRLVFPLNGEPIENGWNGKVDGVVQDAGVYIIKAILVTNGVEETKIGSVLLLK